MHASAVLSGRPLAVNQPAKRRSSRVSAVCQLDQGAVDRRRCAQAQRITHSLTSPGHLFTESQAPDTTTAPALTIPTLHTCRALPMLLIPAVLPLLAGPAQALGKDPRQLMKE